MNWLRDHLRDHTANVTSLDPPKNVLRMPRAAPSPSRSDASEILHLVTQAAEAIKEIDDRANAAETRVQSLAETAVEKLRLAETRIESAETARREAEHRLMETQERLRAAEEELSRSGARIAGTTAELNSAMQRLKAAETRAAAAERAVQQVEHAIRTQLVELTNSVMRKRNAAA